MFIYLMVNQATNKKYVGLSKHSVSRARHRLQTDTKRFPHKPNTLLGDIQEFGIENCTFTLLEKVEEAYAQARRNYWIAYYETWRPQGYN